MKILRKYTNGNYGVTLYDNGTKIRYTKCDKMIPAFAENIDIKITNYCRQECPYCHEGSNRYGYHGDIDLPFFDTLHKGQEVAIGGGNALDHPQFKELLEKLKKKGVITNITVHFEAFREYRDILAEYVSEGLLYGIGISVTNINQINLFVEPELTLKDSLLNNMVFHIINGIFDMTSLISDKLLYKDKIKLLVLGYKKLRRGADTQIMYHYAPDSKVKSLENTNNIKIIKDIINSNTFAAVSFDNLAIEQLKIKDAVSEDVWNTKYMGDDGTSTFYIDCVTETFAESSTAPFDERYPLKDNVDDMFNFIRRES